MFSFLGRLREFWNETITEVFVKASWPTLKELADSTLVVIAVAVIGTVVIVAGGGQKGTGARGPTPGETTPPFAAPLALSNLVGDANIAPDACSVSARRALVSCRAFAKGPVALAFVSVGDKPCTEMLPALARAGRSIPGLTAAAIGIRGQRKELAKLAAVNPGVEVAWDRDGALTNRYGVAVCPTVVVVREGGIVAESLIGEALDDPEVLTSSIRRALAGASTG
jgi:preprotein translocase subunit SecE